MINQFILIKALTNFLIISFFCYLANFQSIIIMFVKPKTTKKNHSNKIVSIIFVLHSIEKLHGKIANYIKIPKLTIGKIL